MTDMSPQPQPGPGPKPAGPTHPTPTHPPKGNGHALPRPPRLGEIIRDAERQGAQMIATLGRQFDPASAPPPDDVVFGPSFVDRQLGGAVANVRAALHELAYLAGPDLPPAGSTVHVQELAAAEVRSCRYPECECESDYPCGDTAAAHVPGPPLAAAADEGDGPPSHRVVPGECLQPGSAAAISGAVSESHGGPLSPGAGDSSDPRPRLSQRAPKGNGVRPGVGFTLPQSKRFLMPGAEEIAEQINASIAAEHDARA